MKNILVVNVAAESGGALTVLNEYYQDFLKDPNNNYCLIISKPLLQSKDNIEVIRLPWVKKNWLYRWFFEYVYIQKIIKKNKYDLIFSLQNTIIPQLKIPQEILLHNALPFSDFKYSIKYGVKDWILLKINKKRILNSINKASKIHVQTKWMKDRISKNYAISENKINITKELKFYDVPQTNLIRNHLNNLYFIYPASAMPFKNHKLIVDACKHLNILGIKDYKVIFTVKGNENKNIKKIFKEVQDQDLNIEFVGNLDKEKLYQFYRKSVLVFPSLVETVGLPLIEAKKMNCSILTIDKEYSREVLKDYKRAKYFEDGDYQKLALYIKSLIKNK